MFHLLLSPFESGSEAEVFAEFRRTEVQTIYDSLIIPDLTLAMDLVEDSYAQSEAGRITRGAVLTLLGDVYLTVGGKKLRCYCSIGRSNNSWIQVE